MKVNELLEEVNGQLQYEAKREIIERYNAIEDEIVNFYEYRKGGELKYRHPFSAVTDEIILDVVFEQMISLCIQTTPLKLLEKKDSSATILRSVNAMWNVRKPNRPTPNGDLDIDESLAQISLYKTLGYFGVTAYSQNAKELLTIYKDTLVLPTTDILSEQIDIRFSTDGNSWRDRYQSGDKFFSIKKADDWGANIPLGGGGVSDFVSLSDTPNSIKENKVLVGGKYGLEFTDMPSVKTNFSSLDDTPNALEANKIIKVNSSADGLEFVDMPSGSGGGGEYDESSTYSASFPYNFVTQNGVKKNRRQELSLILDTTFTVGQMEDDIIYKMIIEFNGSSFSFGSGMRLQKNMPSFSSSDYGIMFDITKVSSSTILVYNVNVIS